MMEQEVPLSEPITRKFTLSTEIEQLGFSRIYAIDKTLFVCGLMTEIQYKYYRYDLQKTMKALKRALVDTNEFGIEIIDKLRVFISQAWIKAEDNNNLNHTSYAVV